MEFLLGLQPLKYITQEYHQSWSLESASSASAAKAEDDEESDSDDSETEDDHPTDSAPHDAISSKSQSYVEFLDFLKLGCNGSPVQGYPVVLVILSTIPSEVSSYTDAFYQIQSVHPS